MPKNRDEFDQNKFLNELEVGAKVIVKDSNKDLPPNWWKLDLGQPYTGKCAYSWEKEILF